jgi:hypothetical protein
MQPVLLHRAEASATDVLNICTTSDIYMSVVELGILASKCDSERFDD